MIFEFGNHDLDRFGIDWRGINYKRKIKRELKLQNISLFLKNVKNFKNQWGTIFLLKNF